ncbi:MAG: FAD-binding oxidoreductase [Candidatus Acidiferrales bacterium]
MAFDAATNHLRQKLRGELLAPADTGYDEARRIFNAMIDRHPALIVRCAHTDDVAAAVRFAREHSLPVSVKGAGHNVAGNAVCDHGVMIDCSGMKRIEVDTANRIAKAQPGPTLGEFDKATTAQGLFTTMGVVSKTGIAGLTLGGGLGWLMGKFGLACDNLMAAEVVTAEGKVVRASAEENADLLWGLRGGGGNFGIVTRFDYRLHPVEPVIGGLVLHPLGRAIELLRFYRELIANCPDPLTLYVAIQNGPDGTPVCGIAAGYCGEPAGGEGLLAPIRAFGSPIADMIAPVSYVQQQSMIDDFYTAGFSYYWRSAMLDTLSDEAMDVLLEYFQRRPSPLTQMFFEHMHGAASRVPPADTAFAHRSNQLNFSALGIWRESKETDANLAWMHEFWRDLRPHLARRAYVNYLGQEGAERVREAYGPNYERLVALKTKYDPTNFFRFNQNTQPAPSAACAG